MRENRLSGSEGGVAQSNVSFLPLSWRNRELHGVHEGLVDQAVLVHRRRMTYYLSMIEQTYPYIVTVDAVRSGRPIVQGTRIGVHDVVGLYINGATVDEITRELPLLSRAQVFECLAYYEDHRADIDLWVAEQMAGSETTA